MLKIDDKESTIVLQVHFLLVIGQRFCILLERPNAMCQVSNRVHIFFDCQDADFKIQPNLENYERLIKESNSGKCNLDYYNFFLFRVNNRYNIQKIISKLIDQHFGTSILYFPSTLASDPKKD